MFQIHRRSCFFILVFLVFPPLLLADPPGNSPTSDLSFPIQEVVVTTNRLDTPLSQVANSMSVITSKDIEQKQAGTALEALQ